MDALAYYALIYSEPVSADTGPIAKRSVGEPVRIVRPVRAVSGVVERDQRRLILGSGLACRQKRLPRRSPPGIGLRRIGLSLAGRLGIGVV